MVLTHTPICKFDTPVPDFRLPDPSGQFFTLQDCVGPKGLLVMFICNHCPYVQAINQKLVRDTTDLARIGINSVAIMSNDIEAHPEDSPANMEQVAREQGYPFPYLFDETQQVARDFGAVCTPDFFGYNARLDLQYRGRLDASGASADTGDVRRDLYLAMKQVAETGQGPREQVASMGCSLKWRDVEQSAD